MSEVLHTERMTAQHLPRLFRSRAVDYTLLVIGAIVAAFGAYTYFAPTDWIWAGLSEGWFLGSWIAGGVMLGAGFGLLGASLRDRAGHWSAGAVTSFVVGMLALGGAVAAVVLLII